MRSWKPETFRADVREFIDSRLPAGWAGLGALPEREASQFAASWRELMAANGLLGLSWPSEYGGAGLGHAEEIVLAEEIARAKAPVGMPNDPFGLQMLGSSLLVWGTEEQKTRLLPRVISGEDRWCQGFSEPGAGSDLAGLTTRAVLRDGRWHISGQKIWTSSARTANWIFVLARTGDVSERYGGLTFLLVPMDQAGITVRPITMLSGDTEFNEVFFDDAQTDEANVVGRVAGGWSVAMTLLGFERAHIAATLPVQYGEEMDRLIEMVKERSLASDPVVRDGLAQRYIRLGVLRALGQKVKAQSSTQPGVSNEEYLFKLAWSEYHQDVTEFAADVLGPAAITVEGEIGPFLPYTVARAGSANTSGNWLGTLLNARSDSFVGGSSEIQRNICAERVLGLPKEK